MEGLQGDLNSLALSSFMSPHKKKFKIKLERFSKAHRFIHVTVHNQEGGECGQTQKVSYSKKIRENVLINVMGKGRKWRWFMVSDAQGGHISSKSFLSRWWWSRGWSSFKTTMWVNMVVISGWECFTICANYFLPQEIGRMTRGDRFIATSHIHNAPAGE